jgi:diadenylate cyclase
MADRSIGLRHRAAIGLTERTDAVAVVVSEETGSISICINGVLQRNLSEKQFREKISEIFFSANSSNETQTAQQLDRKGSLSSTGDSDLVSD